MYAEQWNGDKIKLLQERKFQLAGEEIDHLSLVRVNNVEAEYAFSAPHAYRLYGYGKKEIMMGSFSLSQVPENCGTVVLSCVTSVKDGIGIGSFLVELAMEEARSRDYSEMIATINLSKNNRSFKRIAKKLGWRCIKRFFNGRSGRQNEILAVDLWEK